MLSIVIPTYAEGEGLRVCLESLQALRQAGDEIIVVDGKGCVDAAIQGVLCDQLLRSDSGRARQMNVGAWAARGQQLLFLHVDTRLPDSNQWRPYLGLGWGFFLLRLSGQSWRFRVIEKAIGWRSKLTSVATGDQCIWVDAELFEAIGGFECIPLMEDVALTKALRKKQPPQVFDTPAQTSSRRWEERGITSTVLLMWTLRLGYWLGVSPSRLHRVYYRGRE